MPIQILSDILISRIAAGEVIERPASVIKELVENSIDAKASLIQVKIAEGGQNLIMVKDDGIGIEKAELALALTRHATSKIKSNNLLHIDSLGFRGEGLAAIASISKLSLSSKYHQAKQAYKISSLGGQTQEITSSNLTAGTLVEIRDLFFATPARLKFLKSVTTENNHIIAMLKKIALCHPHISFKLMLGDKEYFSYEKTNLSSRAKEIMGPEFITNSVYYEHELEAYQFKSFASIPTYNRANNNFQHIFINKRPVQDKVILNAIKISYQDFLEANRYPLLILFLNIPAHEIDVNVHPCKTEIRFRDAQKIRNFVITSLKQALKQAEFKSSSTNNAKALSYFQKNQEKLSPLNSDLNSYFSYQDKNAANYSYAAQQAKYGKAELTITPQTNLAFAPTEQAPTSIDRASEFKAEYISFPLGSALAQLHKTYIISQTKNGLIIIDQHAAHERLIYEELKNKLAGKDIKTQQHLFSEIVELDELQLSEILAEQEELAKYGVKIEKFGNNGLIIKETPEIFQEINIKNFIKDLADNISKYGKALNLLDKITEIYGNHCCHQAIRAGRILNIAEMNQILRDMEKTPYSGQCNHGRPTYIELKKSDLEKLFHR
jgi:DNA mismatch repair protein MutL